MTIYSWYKHLNNGIEEFRNSFIGYNDMSSWDVLLSQDRYITYHFFQDFYEDYGRR